MTDYVKPVQQQNYGGLSLEQFFQTVIVGISGIPGPMVRPRWQPEEPKQPDISVNWIALGIANQTPDAGAYISTNGTQETSQRQEQIELSLSIYGPDAAETYGLLRDGFQIDQNRFAMFKANVGFVEISRALRVPDLVNQRWVNRLECSVVLNRQIQRTYPVLTFVSASGIIFVPDITPDYQLAWQVPS